MALHPGPLASQRLWHSVASIGLLVSEDMRDLPETVHQWVSGEYFRQAGKHHKREFRYSTFKDRAEIPFGYRGTEEAFFKYFNHQVNWSQ